MNSYTNNSSGAPASMKRSLTKLRSAFTVLAVLLCSIGLFQSKADATLTTTIYQEGFEKGVPDDWYVNGDWYWSSAGYGDYNGSAMYDFFWNYGNYWGEMQTPYFDLSGYNNGSDKVFVEFDMWFESNYYNMDYGWSDNMYLYGYDPNYGYRQIDQWSTSSDYTSEMYDYYSSYDPNTSPKLWRHVRMELPKELLISSTFFIFSASDYSGAGGNFGIDNFTVSVEQPVNITSNPSFLDFGTISIGAPSAIQTITISNPNPIPVSLSSIVKTGANQSEFQFVGGLPTEVPAYGTTTVSVRFVPTTNGNKYAQVVITNNSDNMPTITVTLLGAGTGPGIEIIPIGDINTPTRMFRKTRTTLGDTLKQSFLVKNNASGALAVSSSSFISGDYPGLYTITRFPAVLGGGQTDTMTIRFIPNQEGSTPARANILSNAYNGTQTIDLFGVGIIPRIVLEPGEVVMMDSIPMGTSTCKSIKISNPGSDTLHITNDYLSSADGDFSYTSLPKINGVAKIAPNGSITVQVCVTPLQNGTRRARLRFTTNIPLTMAQDGPRMDTSAKSVEIWANGVPADRTIIAMGDFNDVVIGDESVVNVTLTNAGSESVTIDAPVFTGANANSFKATKANFPLSVAPGANVNFTVVGAPYVRGINAALLNLTTKSGDRISTQTAAVSVNGLLASSQTNENSLSYAKLFVGEESSQAITITNNGDISQNYIANVSGAGYSLVSDAASDVVMPGSSVIYTIMYAPKAKGISTGTLTVKGTHIADMSVSLIGEADEKPVTQSVKGDVSKNGFILSQNAPNPASGKTAFSFTTPTTSNVHITLVDMTGKTVKNLVNGVYGAGLHDVTVATNEIASGSYLYILETESVRLVRQMVVNK